MFAEANALLLSAIEIHLVASCHAIGKNVETNVPVTSALLKGISNHIQHQALAGFR